MLRSRAGSEREGLIDATIIATGSGVLSWIFLIAPYVRDTELTLAERLVSGDEFALALPDCSVGPRDGGRERLREVTPNRHSFSADLAAWGGESDEELMIRAALALYAARSAGRARTVAAEGTADTLQR